jgi:hypothetical protein
LQLVAKGRVSQGAPSEGLTGQAPFVHSSVARSPRCVCPDQLVVVFRLQLPQAEGMSGNLRRSAFLTPDVLPLPCFLSAFISFLRFTVFFSQKRRRFSPEGRWFSRNSGCQDVTVHPQIRVVWGSFCFCCYFSAALFPLAIIGDFRSGIFHCGASVFFPLQSTVVVLAIFTDATYPTTSHRRFALRTLSFA